MPASNFTISEAEPSIASKTTGFIESQLLDSLKTSQQQAHNASLILTAQNETDSIVGGLTAASSYGWLLVKTLWVDDVYRRCGIGKELMIEAESFADRVNCHGIWLDTSSNAARLFYLSLGFTEFSRLENMPGQFPEDHCRWFLRKTCAIQDNAG